MRVADVSKRLGVTADTVRFYTRNGFLRPQKNLENGYHEYRDSDCQRLRFILSARQLGFSVEDIGQLLGQADIGKSPCPVARELIEDRLEEMERRFADAERLMKRMRAAVKDWSNQPDKVPNGHMICHLIENFGSE